MKNLLLSDPNIDIDIGPYTGTSTDTDIRTDLITDLGPDHNTDLGNYPNTDIRTVPRTDYGTASKAYLVSNPK